MIFDFGGGYGLNDNPRNRLTGYRGEAYVYEYLKSLGIYKSVKWMMLSEIPTGDMLEYRGKTYYIKPDGSSYDILVKRMDGAKLYVEVKTTIRQLGSKVPFFLSINQLREMKRTTDPDQYVLAAVFDVEGSPSCFFMHLIEDP
eukprot:gnl/Chilomastix_caulleri/2806.p1 GENE.gnl/Chilomastix_caulleri/2806~~gnl/Chilomastix_caulleri/2806.p1  ORF type:complete len:143 (+),score=28.39 gnl/Chilomastix_caulleri/2806:103-531(+)